MSQEGLILRDLGERELVRTILPRYALGIGHDCAVLDLNSGQTLVLTTDPVPEPAAQIIGGDSDPYWKGWLLVTINASDLAAAGASPVVFLAAIEAPDELRIAEFERFLLGIKESCEAQGLKYVGGNLREGPKLTAVGTALGSCEAYLPLLRTGADVDDFVVSIGAGGIFWRDTFLIQNSDEVIKKEDSPVFKPQSQVMAVHQFARRGLLKAAIDNSDGLLPSLKQLADASSVMIYLDVSKLKVPSPVELPEPERCWLGWGDWNVLAIVDPNRFDELQEAAHSVSCNIVRIGYIKAGQPEVILKRGNKEIVAPRLESERFSVDSWFSEGIDSYVRMLRSVELP